MLDFALLVAEDNEDSAQTSGKVNGVLEKVRRPG
jgi:hypothetical protein